MVKNAHKEEDEVELDQPEGNVHLVTEFMIKQHTSDGDISRSLNEIITNAFDAKARNCYVKLDTHLGKPAVLFLDDGVGFNRNKIVSVLSYGKSSRKRSDKKTAGVNGTGTKSLLGLGLFEETKVTIYTKSVEYPAGVELSFNYKYLLELFQKKNALMEQSIKPITDMKLFSKGLNRDFGSTIVLTGFDPMKIRSNDDLIDALARRISPRAAQKVRVFKNGVFVPLKTMSIEGEFYTKTFNSQVLGEVTFDLYYGAGNAGPMICGKENSIADFASFFSKLPQADRRGMAKLWNSIGGYVYFENANVFRQHDGSFSEDFIKMKASKNLMALFATVADDLEQFHEKLDDARMIEESQEMLKAMALFSQGADDEVFGSSKGTKRSGIPTAAEYGRVDQPVLIVPKLVQVYRNTSINMALQNLGTKNLDFTGAVWTPSSDAIIVVGKGNKATINAGDKLGPVTVTIKGPFGTHELSVRVLEQTKGAYIEGETLLNPGTEHEYVVRQYDAGRVTWEMSEAVGVRIVLTNDTKQIKLVVHKDAPNQGFDLYCQNINGTVLAIKRIRVTDVSGSRPIVVKVGEHNYFLSVETRYPACAVQIEDRQEGEEFDTICINPLHPQLHKVIWNDSLNIHVTGVAFSATSHQVGKGLINPQMAMNIAWEFVNRMKKSMTENRSKLKKK